MKTAKTKKALLKSLSILALSLSLGACSQQWIESDAELDADSLMEQIDIVQSAAEAGANASATSKFNDLVASPTSYIYYVDGPSPMANAVSAVSFNDFNILGRQGWNALDVENAVAIYVEDVTEDGYESALLIQVLFKGETQPTTQVFVSIEQPDIQDDQYIAKMGNNGEHKLTLRSFYTANGELQSVVQFQVHEVVQGVESWIGKFGAMVGYGG